MVEPETKYCTLMCVNQWPNETLWFGTPYTMFILAFGLLQTLLVPMLNMFFCQTHTLSVFCFFFRRNFQQRNPNMNILPTWVGLFTSFHCNVFCLWTLRPNASKKTMLPQQSLTYYWKLVVQGHLTSSRYQFMPSSNFSGRIVSLLSIFSYIRNGKRAILTRS